ncbi:MAG: hypothetical protein WCI11_17230 [Candidatus Methylumidiphilus sp.]
MKQPGFNFDSTKFRHALMNLPETAAKEDLEPPALTDIYVPAMHSKALSPEVSIVEGMRGSGKSFWTAVLANDKACKFALDTASVKGLSASIVKVGFGLSEDNTDFPSANRITSLLDQGCKPDSIWRSVLMRHALKTLNKKLPFKDSVSDSAIWVQNNRDKADDLLVECDKNFSAQGKTLLLLFDSLDRLANEWEQIRELLSSALRLCLECRTRHALRIKFFLRPDMVEADDEVWGFSDSSKLLHSKVPLEWRPTDLYGLILLHLANNADVGRIFRDTLSTKADIQWPAIEQAYPLPRSLTDSEQLVRGVIEALAGPWVGTSVKKGYTYTWIPTHLSDAKGRLSPRSILLAFKQAAIWTNKHRQNHTLPLHYEGIQQGVVEASKIRINEIKEDYPWVGPLLEALNGATVPLSFAEMTERWTQNCINKSLIIAKEKQRLPPRRYSSTPKKDKNKLEALVDDLVELAVLYRTDDNRLNMPDIFRVGFGIKRKGGVRPPR